MDSARNKARRRPLFQGDMRWLREAHSRFTDPATCEKVLRIAGDALRTASREYHQSECETSHGR